MGTGGDWSPNIRLGGPTKYWSPNLLAVVFKKQEILQQVLLLMSAEDTRMQDLASEFSKIYWGTPGPQQRDGRPLPHSPQPRLWPGAGRLTLVPQLFSRSCAREPKCKLALARSPNKNWSCDRSSIFPVTCKQ